MFNGARVTVWHGIFERTAQAGSNCGSPYACTVLSVSRANAVKHLAAKANCTVSELNNERFGYDLSYRVLLLFFFN